MKQTAVEWLVEQYKKVGGISISMADQAKAMEKEQICYSYVKGAEAEINNPYVTNVEFYNKTFNNESNT
jgi:hypothetical protein